MRIVVHDACALIDLLQGGLVNAWAHCGIEIHTTELALIEVEMDDTPLHATGVLKVKTHSVSELSALHLFKSSVKRSLSLEDCSVLRLAQELKAPLLTGDMDLRKTAEASGLRVHGLIWVLDTLVEKSLLTQAKAATALETLCRSGSRFPAHEVERRLRDWR